MIRHLFSNFLQDESVYRQVEDFWFDLWQTIDHKSQDRQDWKTPWFEPLPPSISEGNPIFSAVSQTLRRGIRILQYEPTESGPEIFAYFDTFGGSSFDPSAIHELVISCALSDAIIPRVISLMSAWVADTEVSFQPEAEMASGISRPYAHEPYIRHFPLAA